MTVIFGYMVTFRFANVLNSASLIELIVEDLLESSIIHMEGFNWKVALSLGTQIETKINNLRPELLRFSIFLHVNHINYTGDDGRGIARTIKATGCLFSVTCTSYIFVNEIYFFFQPPLHPYFCHKQNLITSRWEINPTY